MKNILFFFIFLIIVQNADAIALTPPTLDFDNGNEKSFTILNTNSFETKFIVEPEDGFKFSQNEFTLDAKDRITINVAATDAGKREGIIYVKELVGGGQGLQLENGVGLKYHVKKENWRNKITGAALRWQKTGLNKFRWSMIAFTMAVIIFVMFYKDKSFKRAMKKISKFYCKLRDSVL